MLTMVPRPGEEWNLDVAAELVDVALDHVHADAPAGDVADDVRGGEAGLEDQVVNPLVGELFFHADEAAFARLGEDAVAISPPPSSPTSTQTLPPL